MASDHEEVNFSEFYEIRDWLKRNNYRGTESNWKHMQDELAPLIKEHFNKESSDHLTWDELDEYHKNFPSHFVDLEK